MQFHNYSAVSATRERASGAGAQHLLLSLKYPAALYLGSASWKVFGSPKFLMMIPKHLTPSVFFGFCFLRDKLITKQPFCASGMGRGARTTPFKLKL